jgi:hypothetical protein
MILAALDTRPIHIAILEVLRVLVGYTDVIVIFTRSLKGLYVIEVKFKL